MSVIEVRVPDIGDFQDVEIIEILVKPGDSVEAETSMITLESDKATMDVPAPQAGVVAELLVKVGDRVSEGSSILKMEATSAPEGKSSEDYRGLLRLYKNHPKQQLIQERLTLKHKSLFWDLVRGDTPQLSEPQT